MGVCGNKNLITIAVIEETAVILSNNRNVLFFLIHKNLSQFIYHKNKNIRFVTALVIIISI